LGYEARDAYIVDVKVHYPRVVNLVCDATKRRDTLGILVFKDSVSKEILIWKHNIEIEIVKDYRYLKEELISHGYTIASVTLDGK